jgi:hypothetical protein
MDDCFAACIQYFPGHACGLESIPAERPKRFKSLEEDVCYLFLWRCLALSFLCLCFRIFLRLFFTTLPMKTSLGLVNYAG